jgi:hypothetical protein
VIVEIVPMRVVNQGEVAVAKAYVGLATEDTSGADFKFAVLVRPGHRGIWQEPLRTGTYAINPRCCSIEIVPTFILTPNWAQARSSVHHLDQDLKEIVALWREGFVFGHRSAGAYPCAGYGGAEAHFHRRLDEKSRQ